MASLSALPQWSTVLVVVAHPDDESFALGAVIEAFVAAGAVVDVLCLTHGEASTLGAAHDLGERREAELAAAASALGARRTRLLGYADGALAAVDSHTLAGEVLEVAAHGDVEGLLVFDSTGLTGHPDHVAATAAALLGAENLDLPVLAWTLTEQVAQSLREETSAPFVGRPDEQIDLVLRVDRSRQRVAIACHASQAVPGSVLWRRLDLQGDVEVLRWLRPPSQATPSGAPS